MITFGYGKALECLLQGFLVRRVNWPARSYLKMVTGPDDFKIFVKVTEENEDEVIETLDEWTANTQDAIATDWCKESPEKFIVAVLNDQIKILRDNPISTPSLITASELFWSGVSYKEIRAALEKSLPVEKLIKGDITG